MDELKNNLPLISIGLLILGTVNLMLYYNHFNIDILSYLDFTEILQIQFRLFATAAALIVFLILFLTIWDRIAAYLYKPTEEAGLTEADIKARKKTSKYSSYAFYLYLIVISVLNFARPVYKEAEESTASTLLWMFSVVGVAGAVVYTYFQLKKISVTDSPDEVARKKGLTTLKYVGVFIILTYSSGVFARLEAEDTVSLRSSYEATVVMEKKSFATNKNYRYLGRTKNFTFFYDIARKQAEVFPNGDIKNMFVRDGIDYRTVKEKSGFTFTISFTKIANWFKGLFT